MQSDEVGVPLLYDEGAEGKSEGDVVECVGFLIWVVREDCARDGKLEWRCHCLWRDARSCDSVDDSIGGVSRLMSVGDIEAVVGVGR